MFGLREGRVFEGDVFEFLFVLSRETYAVVDAFKVGDGASHDFVHLDVVGVYGFHFFALPSGDKIFLESR